ncbi:MAG TPA: ring-cleaving dioxygenase [Candidatus Polarisedimenticolaceae bacterium]|nr:ring-cleaving dioxygenase [Candidatus Polarisedimenticolaceae bacterium]
MSEPTITGIHHITAIAGDPQRNLDFYTGVLGLRLVKLTVNFDDPGTYHFYFGDAKGSPGSILTFFPWVGVRRGLVGTGQVAATSFAVPAGSIGYWQERLASHEIRDVETRFGEQVVRFEDPDGLPLEIVGTDTTPSHGNAIAGFHSATLLEEGYEKTAALLEKVMGLTPAGNDGNRFRYRMGVGGPGKLVDVVCAPDSRPGRLGGGTVHHIAWRTPDDTQQLAWRKRLVGDGFNVSPVMDRTYFHSIYYREPGGILFEIATDPPGFAIDEPADHLGERLMLPPHVESYRKSLERALPPLTLPHVSR